ncbi:glycogen phosphorylase [Segniliparus rotundus DSM 44985]|uniref:Glycogen phosphorylase n=1 Tax=Segniliparus rotundus (strain ATCC BAA-972 / CDC 1076 / CIP 108378 / DSM 44985 / JCM 13578) TaxID=640132 RepID=D6ZDS1_SEGRD|nr:glycogen phosphorylase [Segniliparus rotundus DSM 44985]
MRQIDRRTLFRGAKAPSYVGARKQLMTRNNIAKGPSAEGNRGEKGKEVSA